MKLVYALAVLTGQAQAAVCCCYTTTHAEFKEIDFPEDTCAAQMNGSDNCIW